MTSYDAHPDSCRHVSFNKIEIPQAGIPRRLSLSLSQTNFSAQDFFPFFFSRVLHAMDLYIYGEDASVRARYCGLWHCSFVVWGAKQEKFFFLDRHKARSMFCSLCFSSDFWCILEFNLNIFHIYFRVNIERPSLFDLCLTSSHVQYFLLH